MRLLHPAPLRLLLLFVASAAGLLGASGSREAFLRLLERPRVPLGAEEHAAPPVGGLQHVQFSFASEAGVRVPGLLVRPAGPPTRRPAVLVLHGTGDRKEGQLPKLEELARAGFVAVAIDGRYHGARRASPDGTKEYQAAIARAFREGGAYPFYYDTVWDVLRLLDLLATREDVDAARIGAIGFSKGGIETYLAAAADPRLAVVVPCIGVQSFRWALENDQWQHRVGTVQEAFTAAAAAAGVAAPDAAFARRFYDRVVPGIYAEFDGPAMLPQIAPRPLLVINGDSDRLTPVPGVEASAVAARAAYAAQGADDRFVLRLQADTGHAVTPESHAEALAWFVRWLRP